ncbi:MAG: hypothetical protein AAGA56_22060, partial [Myxococcota bacterium]
RRCGFTFGLLVGSALGGLSGFENDALRIDRDEFRTTVDFAAGFSGHLYVGIALTDWITFGAGFGLGGMQGSDTQTNFNAFTFRIESFPRFGLGGQWRELGLMFDAGLGSSTTAIRETEDEVIQSGLASRFGAGLFWEGIQAWKLSMGPFAAFDSMFSQSVEQYQAWLGWRTAFYAGPSQ